jgi:hypothetical protein
LALKGGEIVTVNEETTDHRAGETTVLAQQQVRWMSLAQSVAELVGRPLTLDPAISGPPRTFVQAIDRIVQRRVKQLGPNNLSVNIRGSKDLGVEIVVNGKSYAAVDEVEDESVRSLIQASIYEWQDRDK